MFQADARTGPDQPLKGPKAQILGAEAETVGPTLDHQATPQCLQQQRRQPRSKPDMNVLKGQVGGHTDGLTASDIAPQAQGALPRLQVNAPARKIGVVAQPCDIDPWKIPIQLTVPAMPGSLARRTDMAQVQQGLTQAGAQVQALTPFGRRRSIQPYLVRAPGVAHHQVNA